MKSLTYALLLVLVMASAGRYHAKVNTGRTPSTVVIDRPFASGWIYGLVPPSEISTAAECPNGVALVETRLSFVNQLVSGITLGIYTPMHIKVTCAAGGTSALDSDHEVVVRENASEVDVSDAFSQAADQAVATGGLVVVRFESANM